MQVHATPSRPGWSVMELCGHLTARDASTLLEELVEEVAEGVTEIVVDARHLESSEHPLSPLLQRVAELLAPAGGSVIVTAPPPELGDVLAPDGGEQRQVRFVDPR